MRDVNAGEPKATACVAMRRAVSAARVLILEHFPFNHETANGMQIQNGDLGRSRDGGTPIQNQNYVHGDRYDVRMVIWYVIQVQLYRYMKSTEVLECRTLYNYI